jgi:hypothetical protein
MKKKKVGIMTSVILVVGTIIYTGLFIESLVFANSRLDSKLYLSYWMF